MAQKVTVSLQDDLDGSPAAETVRFALAGAEFEIDLSVQNACAFRHQIHPFLEHARRIRTTTKARPASRSVASRERTSSIRAWARDHGISINERGRIPGSIIEQYEAATNGR
jgi:hypothetical protein